MKKTLVTAALMAAVVAPAASVAAGANTAEVACYLAADAAAGAAVRRLGGLTQEQTAQEATEFFTTQINSPEASRKFSNEERREIAAYWGDLATGMIRLVYSLPKKDLQDPVKVAGGVYVACINS